MFENMNIGDIALALVILSSLEIVVISHLLYKTHKYKLYLIEKRKRTPVIKRNTNSSSFFHDR